jgi:hypothetical protein
MAGMSREHGTTYATGVGPVLETGGREEKADGGGGEERRGEERGERFWKKSESNGESRRVPRGGVVNAQETAFLLHMTGDCGWARRGAGGVRIAIHRNEKLSYGDVAVTAL